MESLRRAGLGVLMILLYLVAGKNAGALGGDLLYRRSVRPAQVPKRQSRSILT